jgi:hypothetical protein
METRKFIRVVEGAADTQPATVEHVSIDDGGTDVVVAEKLLNGPNVVA